MDLVLAVHRLLPNAEYSDGSSYERLQATWFDNRALPTQNDLDIAWDAILAERQAFLEKAVREEQLRADAKTNVGKIPAWATMTEAEAVTFIQSNVTDLASARTVLVAMARMLVALRDAQWPDLGEN